MSGMCWAIPSCQKCQIFQTALIRPSRYHSLSIFIWELMMKSIFAFMIVALVQSASAAPQVPEGALYCDSTSQKATQIAVAVAKGKSVYVYGSSAVGGYQWLSKEGLAGEMATSPQAVGTSQTMLFKIDTSSQKAAKKVYRFELRRPWEGGVGSAETKATATCLITVMLNDETTAMLEKQIIDATIAKFKELKWVGGWIPTVVNTTIKGKVVGETPAYITYKVAVRYQPKNPPTAPQRVANYEVLVVDSLVAKVTKVH